MSEGIWVAVIAFGGTLIGTFGGILTSSRLTSYRIEQLEKKVDKHNEIIERTFKLEEACTVFEERFKVVNHRIDELKHKE